MSRAVRGDLHCQCACGLPGCYGNVNAGPGHGTVKRYNKGCRCDLCCERKAVLTEHQRQRRARETVDGARNSGKQWTGADLEIALREDLSVTELALLLGRTYASVDMARVKSRNDPKWVQAVGLRSAD